MLHSLTTAVNFVALMVALWLGLYLVTRSPRRPETWLAALTLWSMGGYFLNRLLALNSPPAPPEETRIWLHHLILFWPRNVFELGWQGWLQGWLPAYSVIFWYHTTLYMLPGRFNRKRLILAVAGYACVLASILIKARYYHSTWIDPGSGPLYYGPPGSILFLMFGAGFLVFAGLSTLNLTRIMRSAPGTMPRDQFRIFITATVLAGVSGLPGIAAYLLDTPMPQVLTALMLLAALLLTGIGVARHNALLDHRPLQRDFLYSGAEAGAILLIYMLFHRLFMALYPIPAVSFVFVGCLAVITHLLIDISRHQLDRIYLHDKNRQLRLRLRQLLLTLENNEVVEVLETALEMIGDSITASWSTILRFTPSGLQPVAAWNWMGSSLNTAVSSLSAADLQAADLVVLNPQQLPPPFEQAAVMVPLYEDAQAGVLLVGPSRRQTGYSEIELVTLQDAGEILATLLRESYGEQEDLARPEIAALPAGVEQFAPIVEISPRLVELGLRHLHDYAYLADSPLANLRLVEGCLERSLMTHIDRGKAVSAMLEEAMARLRPTLEEPNDTPPRPWYPYIILRDAYLDGEPNRKIMARLYISEGTFNRTRRAAIGSIARMLSEMEASAN